MTLGQEPSSLRLYLFGSPRLERLGGLEQDGAAVEVRPRKAFALLIYLAMTSLPHSRDALATLFWPESDQTAARASLRRTLYLLQQLLPPGLLAVSGDTIRLASRHDLWIDVAAFQAAVAAALPSQATSTGLSASDHETLVTATTLYTNDFLAGFTLEDAPGFDEWHFFQQENLRQSFAQMLVQLKESYTAGGDFVRALEVARRWLALDPLHEPAHRDLMRLYVWAGQQAAARRQYQECVRILQEELGVSPEASTVELYQAISAKQLPPPPVAQPVAPKQEVARVDPAPSPVTELPAASQQQIPHYSTAFVGREAEIDHIYRLLTEEPSCRLLTLVGPSGIGKTRLALEVLHRIQSQKRFQSPSDSPLPFAGGAVFVPLVQITEANAFTVAIAAAVGLQCDNGFSAQQLFNFIQAKQMLLLLDHVEHFPAAERLVADLLVAAPKVKILTTSIESIHLQEAWLLPVGSLSFPSADDEPATALRQPEALRQSESLRQSEALRLFEERARRMRSTFRLEDEARHALRICRLVEGNPLAIELAATWLKVLSTEKVAEEIERGLDILTTGYEDVPARHRSMRAVLARSWDLLEPQERAIFMRLAIFRNDFTAEAAHVVVGAELRMLATLVDKSLLQLLNNGRYHCHELLRQFAVEQLLLEPEAYGAVSASHCRYYMQWLQRHGQAIKGHGQRQALAEISIDLSNVLLAWRQAVAERAIDLLAAAAPTIWLFSHYRGLLDEGEAAFAEAIAGLSTVAPVSPATESAEQTHARAELLAILQAGQGWMQGRRGDLEKGRALMEMGIARLRQIPQRNAETEAFAVSYLALLAQYQENHVEAREIVRASLERYTALGDLWGMAMGLEIAGTAALGYGQLEEAKQLLRSCLTIAQAACDQRSQLLAMNYLGSIAVLTGDYGDAKAQLDEALRLALELSDRIATAAILTQLGKWALAQGEYGSAIDHFEQSLANLGRAGIAYTAEVLDFLAATRCAQGDTLTAEQIGRQAYQMAQARGIQRRIVSSLSLLGAVAAARQDYAQAVELQRQALAICQRLAHEPDSASILRYLGHALLAQGESQQTEARQQYQVALQLALKHRLAPLALDCLVGVAQLLRHIQNDEAATHLLQVVAHHPAAAYTSRQNALTALAGRAAAPFAIGDAGALWQSAAQEALDLIMRPDWGQPRQLARNLPTHLTPFVGRQQEIHTISQTLANPNCRLLTLVGLGGIGKTRVAIQVAHHLATSAEGSRLFGDGIIFVPLATAGTEDELTLAIAEAVGIPSYGTALLRQQLLQALANQKCLLVLDNIEQLGSNLGLLDAILDAAPRIKLLITTRVALDLADAWFYPLGGMSFPSPNSTLPLESYEAVQLFAQCARRVRTNFSVETSREAIIHICQLVEGMPLAIELAASWLKVLMIENVAEEISRGMDILSTRSGGVPVRHQSVRVIIQQSWQFLSEEEQQVFMALALFRGGFRRDAAAKVAGATLPLLAQLVEKSLLRVTENGRYSIHELLRQFALERLLERPDVVRQVQREYSAYYVKFLADRLQPVVGWQKQAAVTELEEEIDNITQGWQVTLRLGDLATTAAATTIYLDLLWQRGHAQIGRAVFTQAVQELNESASARLHPSYSVVFAHLHYALGCFQYFLGEFAEAVATLEAGINAALRVGETVLAADAMSTQAAILLWQGRNQQSLARLDEAVALFQAADNQNGLSDALHEQARLAAFAGDYERAKQLATASAAAAASIQRRDYWAYALLERGENFFYQGHYAESHMDIETALAMFQEIGHPVGTAYALGSSAWLIWATGGIQSAEAERRARQSLEIARAVGHRLQIASRLAQMAQFANDRGDYAAAEQFSREGQSFAAALHSPHFLSHNLLMLGEAAFRQGDFGRARLVLGQACRVALEAGLYGRVLLAIYYAAHLLAAEAESATEEDTEEDSEIDTEKETESNKASVIAGAPEAYIDQRAQAIVWLELYLRHPAAWSVFKEKGARQLAYLRAQATEAARLANEALHDDAPLAAMLTNATDTIAAWAGIASTHS